MSYIDHKSGEINAKVVWLGDVNADFALLTTKLWGFRSKPKAQELSLDEGKVRLLSLRLPPYRKFHGYPVRYHLHGLPRELVDDPVALRGTDAIVCSSGFARPPVLEAGIVVIERSPSQSAIDVGRTLSEAIFAALRAGEEQPPAPARVDENEYVNVGPFPFLVDLEGLEPSVDETDVRSRLLIGTPNGYDLIVLVYPKGAAEPSQVFADGEQTWGEPERSKGPVLAGFAFERALYPGDDDIRGCEVLVCPMHDWLLVATFVEYEGAESVEALRRYFLTMIEGAILRSPENRP